MAIKINRWSPDTCGCILHYTWDDSVPQEEIVTEFFAVEKVCSDHASLVTTAAPTVTTFATNNKRSIITQALDNNKHRNLERFDNRISTMTMTTTELKAPKPQRLIDEERNTLTAQLEKHTNDVQERYDAILSTDFANAKQVFETVNAENKLKNKALTDILLSKTELQSSGTTSLRQDVVFTWTWNGTAPHRSLDVSFTDNTKDRNDILTETDKDTLTNKTDARVRVV